MPLLACALLFVASGGAGCEPMTLAEQHPFALCIRLPPASPSQGRAASVATNVGKNVGAVAGLGRGKPRRQISLRNPGDDSLLEKKSPSWIFRHASPCHWNSETKPS